MLRVRVQMLLSCQVSVGALRRVISRIPALPAWGNRRVVQRFVLLLLLKGSRLSANQRTRQEQGILILRSS